MKSQAPDVINLLVIKKYNPITHKAQICGHKISQYIAIW